MGPSASMKTAGAYFATVRVKVLDAPCPFKDRTITGYRPAASVVGICALICPADVASSGIGLLFSVTQTLPRMVGSGVFAAVALVPRLRPMIATKPFGAIAGWKFARLTMPLFAI